MDVSNILKIGLVAFGGYMLYQRYAGSSAGPAPGGGGTLPVGGGTVPVGGGGVVTPPASTVPAPGTSTAPLTVSDEVLAQAASSLAAAQTLNPNIRFSVDQWNYYNAQATGVANPDPVSVGMIAGDRGELINVLEYHARRSAAGLAGVRGMRGLVPFRARWA